MEWVTTSTIIRDLRDHSNQAAWGSFVDRFQGPVLRFISGLGFPPQDAQDVSQEALAAFAEGLRSGRYERERGGLRAWLFGIAYKQALRQRQSTGRHERLLARGEAAERAVCVVPDEKSAGEQWNTLWEKFLVEECFRQVRLEFRLENVRAFEMMVREGYDAREAAAAVGTTTRAVYSAKHRILTRMRELRSQLESLE
ncbi:MAG: sigma-70 family RNA polymerase sigma factor [Akkermansiaceae bacterium]|nr:sigma-70 family RNA polymerase sigma factor [Akkermansiaceae bacterium]